MPETPSSAAPGHFQAKVPFEVGIRRGVLLVAFALTFDWVIWTVADLSSHVLPLLGLPQAWEIEGWHTAQLVLSVLLLVPLFLGTVWLTRWPGPAGAHKPLVRVLVIAGSIIPFGLRAASSVLGGALGVDGIGVFFQVVGLVGLAPFLAIVIFCALVVRDRGHPELAAKFKTLALAYGAYRVLSTVVFSVIFLLHSGYGLFSITRLISIVFLGLFLWLFTKTWRTLV